MNAAPLDKPRTVYANGSCVEVRDDGKGPNKLVTIYKTHCHPVCFDIPDIGAHQIAHPSILHCAAFNGSEYCIQCKHHWQEHLHILYELTEETVTAVDYTIQQKLATHANNINLRETALKQHEQRIAEYKQEREIIRNATAKFGVFLLKYSLAPYNDALIAYLDYLIKEEQMNVQAGGSKTFLQSLEEQRHIYAHAIQSNRDVINSSKANLDTISEVDIDQAVRLLCRLERFGSSLKKLKLDSITARKAPPREISYTVGAERPRKQRIQSPSNVRHNP